MSSREKLILKNPYQSNQIPIKQHQNEDQSFYCQDQDRKELQTQLQFNASQAYSFSNIRPSENDEVQECFQGYSQTNARPLSVYVVQLSGVHEKYLSEESWSLPKKTFKTQTKPPKSKKTSANIKFSKAKSERQGPVNLNIDPISQGFSSLQINTQALLQSFTRKPQVSQEEQAALFSQMGLKQPKALGKGRSKRDFEGILNFLQKGVLPTQHVNDFLQLLSSCMRPYKFILAY